MEKFVRKNEVGLDVTYTVIGKYEKDGKNYIIYTDFVTDNTSIIGLKLFVDLVNKGKSERLISEEEKNIIKEFNLKLLNGE
ncbi:MAG: hypothetical protein IJ568_01760 [Bacilli bacterium]|nr:hypothetical protein [Bacilli bacterium]